MIETLREAHVEQVAALHMRTLTGLLTQLGASAARAYYRGATQATDCVGLVDVTDSQVSGFVFGSLHPERLTRQVVRRSPFSVAVALTGGLVASPKALALFLWSFRGPQEGGYDQRAPSLVYLAVEPQAQGAGVGRALVEAFETRLRSAAATYYDLSVDEDNAVGIAFYERLGFQLVGRYREFDAWHRRYRKSLA